MIHVPKIHYLTLRIHDTERNNHSINIEKHSWIIIPQLNIYQVIFITIILRQTRSPKFLILAPDPVPKLYRRMLRTSTSNE